MTVQEFIALIDAIIWPASLIIIILLFRKSISRSFSRLGSITANSSGLSLNFESALAEAQEVFDLESSSPQAKSFNGIHGTSITARPYEQLVAIKKSIESTLLELAVENSISIKGKKLQTISSQLAQQQVFSQTKNEKMAALLTAVDSAPLSINHHQVAVLQRLHDAI
ncbi:hypothetical protein [Nonlabens marinus]|uniref:Uncharacterized protein n=1 Tax=Nonlabens marinus S1-08 TaxID=1454201 RepID=W8VRL6_9FLAO|nr:hypothetical protein [Nonlabens marinus]BAO56349.1 hypothetical protein NMS_2340 [Nonlabens marinus S1-08]